MTTDEQERRIASLIAALEALGFEPEEVAEAAERMRRVEDDADYHNRVAEQRIAGGSGG